MLHLSGSFVLSWDICMLRHLEGYKCTRGSQAHCLFHPTSSHRCMSKQLPNFPLNTCLCKKARDLGRTKCKKKCISRSKPTLLQAPSLGMLRDPRRRCPGPCPPQRAWWPMCCHAEASSIPVADCPINPGALKREKKMKMTSLLHGGLVALKLNSLSNAVMQEGTFMD